MVLGLRNVSTAREKSLGKMTRPSTSEPFHKESKIDQTPLCEGLRRRRQPGTATGETIPREKLPETPSSIHTDEGHRHVDTVPPKKKKRRLPLIFKGFGSSSRKQQRPSPTSAAFFSIARSTSPSKKEPPLIENFSNEMFETEPNNSDRDYDEECIFSGFKEFEQIGSDYQGWERLERKFEIREEMLKRLSEGKSEAYVEMLRHHEEAARQQKRKEYRRKVTENGSPRGSHTKKMDASVITSESLPTENGLLGKVRRILLFEGYHSAQAITIILFSSVVGIAIYDMVETFLREIAGLSAPYVNIHQFHALLIMFCLIVMRKTGYIWWWLQEDDSYECVRFELCNRLELGYWDARLMYYLSRSGKTLAGCLNIICFYSMYVGISYFYYLAMDVLLWGTLGVLFERISKEAASALEGVSGLEEKPNVCDGSIQTLVSNPISRFVGSRLCMPGNREEFALAFNIVSVLVAASVYNYMVGSSLMPFLI